METKYVYTAWAQNFIIKEDAEDIMGTLDCCDEDKKIEDFELCWFDERKFLEDEASMPRQHTNKPFKFKL